MGSKVGITSRPASDDYKYANFGDYNNYASKNIIIIVLRLWSLIVMGTSGICEPM